MRSVLLCVLLFLFPVFIVSAQDSVQWFRSNASGMALELIPSRFAALRNEYCLSVERLRPDELPDLLPGLLMPYYDDSYSGELRILYENGKEFRRQWIFRDIDGSTRLTAAGSNGFFGGTGSDEPEEEPAGFIELLDDKGSIIKEIRFEADLSQWEYRYSYKGDALFSAEVWYKEPPDSAVVTEETAGEEGGEENQEEAAGEEGREENQEEAVFNQVSTDYYLYSRSGSLRAIDRILSEKAGERSRIPFPRIVPGLSANEEFVAAGVAYTSDFLSDITISEGAKVSYTLDSRGRILEEIWKDEDDQVLGKFQNTWSGDRLQSVLWKSDDDERLVEYEYDNDGNRMAERDFRQGTLERSVTSLGDREVEEIYMDGKIILRAYWEKGLKISEERAPFSGRPAELPGEKSR